MALFEDVMRDQALNGHPLARSLASTLKGLREKRAAQEERAFEHKRELEQRKFAREQELSDADRRQKERIALSDHNFKRGQEAENMEMEKKRQSLHSSFVSMWGSGDFSTQVESVLNGTSTFKDWATSFPDGPPLNQRREVTPPRALTSPLSDGGGTRSLASNGAGEGGAGGLAPNVFGFNTPPKTPRTGDKRPVLVVADGGAPPPPQDSVTPQAEPRAFAQTPPASGSRGLSLFYRPKSENEYQPGSAPRGSTSPQGERAFAPPPPSDAPTQGKSAFALPQGAPIPSGPFSATRGVAEEIAGGIYGNMRELVEPVARATGFAAKSVAGWAEENRQWAKAVGSDVKDFAKNAYAYKQANPSLTTDQALDLALLMALENSKAAERNRATRESIGRKAKDLRNLLGMKGLSKTLPPSPTRALAPSAPPADLRSFPSPAAPLFTPR